ncbi:uncharacterized protein ASPGLDRAFT_48435 [Aspergillus glaucus CBS 516.65]|uniref:Uncharacterized protein n=1 Tax=Aspergillus glaucus CBS 516.65 TaxID=1160497 RepID=A0A1L9VGV7_ASPGL|nr:hypothetical protein ASPGLDRAFT_48435 [Aspergillus glaucus CBS 516.65]OJJ83072.1 hypothetical protein ASPGLDRAFT_48435 [Aspergillus glaucus CBS 516.65]
MANDACSNRVGVQHDSAACARPGRKYYHNDERYTLPITLNSSGLWWKQHPAHVIFMRFAALVALLSFRVAKMKYGALIKMSARR